MRNTSYIGIIDSGLGGLSVLRYLTDYLPEENYIFYGDTLHMPYGEKTKAEIETFAMQDIAFLQRFDIKALSIACNTIDSNAQSVLNKEYAFPIYGIIQPTCIEAVKQTKTNHIAVLATQATTDSQIYPKTIKEINPDIKVDSIACPKLVPLIETGHFEKEDPLVQEALQEYLETILPSDVDVVVLGCTHYPWMNKAIKSFVGDRKIVNSSKCVAKKVVKELQKEGIHTTRQGIQTYYVSSDTESFTKKAHALLHARFNGDVLLADF